VIHVAIAGAAARTDFSTWDRPTLERFAREAADENRELRADLRAALDAYRFAVSEAPPPNPASRPPEGTP
jgi:hypothetical protein